MLKKSCVSFQLFLQDTHWKWAVPVGAAVRCCGIIFKQCTLLSELQGKVLFFPTIIQAPCRAESINQGKSLHISYVSCRHVQVQNSGKSQKTDLLPPAKVFDSKWKLVRRDEGTKELWAISPHSATESRESP